MTADSFRRATTGSHWMVRLELEKVQEMLLGGRRGAAREERSRSLPHHSLGPPPLSQPFLSLCLQQLHSEHSVTTAWENQAHENTELEEREAMNSIPPFFSQLIALLLLSPELWATACVSSLTEVGSWRTLITSHTQTHGASWWLHWWKGWRAQCLPGCRPARSHGTWCWVADW